MLHKKKIIEQASEDNTKPFRGRPFSRNLINVKERTMWTFETKEFQIREKARTKAPRQDYT